MIRVGDYVNKVDTDRPTGVIETVNVTMNIATVRWGVSDKNTYSDDIPVNELRKIDHKVWSPDELLKRQAEEAGGKIIEESNE